ncbi:hypothetical protein IP69_08630 [Bosea sp. AAP35]|nr:hypothetical protein IP69_08630 [Bosea sp. AAP35]
MCAFFAAADIDNAYLEARWLVDHAVGQSDDPADVVDEIAVERIAQYARRRLTGEPLWRIVGEREFWGLPFTLSAGTLEPRPDSETVVEAAFEHIGTRRDRTLSILDLGTGTGCLLVALLSECGAATGLGIDLSAQACETARANAARNGVAERVHIRQGSWTAGLDRTFDLIMSNPPYIPTATVAILDASVREHDPALALDGGSDGLDPYRVFAGSLPALLAEGGAIVLEIGAGQEDDVKAIMQGGGLVWRGSRRDLGGHPRALIFALP